MPDAGSSWSSAPSVSVSDDAQPRRRLVEQEDARLGREGTRDLDEPLRCRSAGCRRAGARPRGDRPGRITASAVSPGSNERSCDQRRRISAATSTLSRTDSEPKVSRRWKVRARCPCGPAGTGRRGVTSRPSTMIRPSFGSCRPVATLNSVVLPAPFGPMSPVMVAVRRARWRRRRAPGGRRSERRCRASREQRELGVLAGGQRDRRGRPIGPTIAGATAGGSLRHRDGSRLLIATTTPSGLRPIPMPASPGPRRWSHTRNVGAGKDLGRATVNELQR